jgi:hypothetical protein
MIAKVTTELDAIRPIRPGISYECPADFGTKLMAFFAYPSKRGDVVTVDLTSCNAITNGHLHRLGRNAPVIGQLAGLAVRVTPSGSSGTGTGTSTGVGTTQEGTPPVPIWEPAGNGA